MNFCLEMVLWRCDWPKARHRLLIPMDGQHIDGADAGEDVLRVGLEIFGVEERWEMPPEAVAHVEEHLDQFGRFLGAVVLDVHDGTAAVDRAGSSFQDLGFEALHIQFNEVDRVQLVVIQFRQGDCDALHHRVHAHTAKIEGFGVIQDGDLTAVLTVA